MVLRKSSILLSLQAHSGGSIPMARYFLRIAYAVIHPMNRCTVRRMRGTLKAAFIISHFLYTSADTVRGNRKISHLPRTSDSLTPQTIYITEAMSPTEDCRIESLDFAMLF